ncbi:tetratricopeptide repeat protein [Chryseobacterium sp. MYb264]|uniref:tetratricopeptide repeat protein n=1 Tax=Chryseobacterium sp. MYb264 TaxID=2745153 RepID=UPI002E15D117|nr:tetratricopeptide repeat protein [Chryseobacterium sp. MYb264]
MKHYIVISLLILFPVLGMAQKKNSIEYANILIKKGVDALYKKDHTQSLEIFADLKTLAKSNNWYNQEFIATNCIGLNYYEMSDYSEALDYYLQAYAIAMKHLTKDNEKTVLNNIALVYFEQEKYKESEKHQKRAYELALDNKDSLGIAIYADNLANLYNRIHQLDKASEYIQIAKSMAQALKKPLILVDITISDAQNSLQRKDFDKALHLLEPIRETLKAKNQKVNRMETFLILSKIFQGKKEYEKALSYAIEARKTNINYPDRKEIYSQFSDLYFETGDYKKALAYKDSIIVVKDSVNAIKNKAMYQNSEIKLRLQDSQKELYNEKKLKFYIGAFCFLILALLSCFFRIIYLKNRQKRTLAEKNQQIISLDLKNKENDNLLLEKQIREKETESLLEKEKLKNELESRNRKLAANAIHIAQRNDKIENYILKLKKNSIVLKNDQFSKQLDQLKEILTKEDYHDDFLTHFERINSKFIDNLKEKHPDLTLNDIRFISYIYMNLSIKEISSIFNITIEACRKRKERISRKMLLTNSSNLFDYISGI